MTDNKSAFAVNRYDENVRKVIPFYDEIYEQIFSVIQAHCGSKPLAVLDTGCGTGTLGQMALERLNLSELVLCDPSEKKSSMINPVNFTVSARKSWTLKTALTSSRRFSRTTILTERPEKRRSKTASRH